MPICIKKLLIIKCEPIALVGEHKTKNGGKLKTVLAANHIFLLLENLPFASLF